MSTQGDAERVGEPTSVEVTSSDAAHMARALELAARGPAADPNPRVGCVLTTPDGTLLAEGWHRGAGTPHAEAAALAEAAGHGIDVRGATAYVTLEPCTHTGRTGPCTDALIAAGVARVVIGAADPNPVAAGGADRLGRAGVEVTRGVLEEQARELNHAWLAAARLGRPFVTFKYAATLDGRVAAADGSSRWITGPESRDRTAHLRAECGAVVVGTGTVLADDPHLTARPGGVLARRQPLRVVVGLRDIPAGARVLDDAAPTLHLRTRDPHEVLAALHEREVRHVWLEGGPRLAGAFLAAGLVDEVLAFVAPALLGAGPSAVEGIGVHRIEDAHRLTLTSVERIGADVLLRLVPGATTEGDR